MRFLTLSLVVLLTACAAYPVKKGFLQTDAIPLEAVNPFFGDSSMDYVYRMDIQAFNNHLTGNLIIKKLGPSHHRIVGTSQMGNTLFDFELEGDQFTTNRILGMLDRKRIIALLEQDLRALITEHPPIFGAWQSESTLVYGSELGSRPYYYFILNGQLYKIVETSRLKEKTELLFLVIEGDIVKKCKILHHDIDVSLELNLL